MNSTQAGTADDRNTVSSAPRTDDPSADNACSRANGAPYANGHEPARHTRLRTTPWSSRDGDWRLSAACRSVDPDQFFPVSAIGTLEQVAAAKAICARCPVELDCLAFALRTRQAHGIWGGLTEQDRQHVGAAQRTAVQSPTGVTTTSHQVRPDA